MGAATVARLLQDRFYRVDPFDPTTCPAVAVVLAAVTLAVAYRPAVRATRAHPDEAPRAE